MCAWFNKKTARAMAAMAANLKAESQARAEAEEKLKAAIESKAEIERKIKAEAEKMLLDQFNKYNALIERAEARTKEAMAEARAKVREAEEKILSYEMELAQTQERLNEVKELMKNQTIARAKAEERLLIESEQRRRVEAELEEAISLSEAEAQERVQQFADAPAGENEKLIKAEEQAETEISSETKESVKAEEKKFQKNFEKPAESTYRVKRVRRPVFNPGNLKKKFILLLVIVIFSAITFAFNVNNKPAVDEAGGSMIEDAVAAEVALAGVNENREQLKSVVKTEMSLGSLSGPEPDTTNAPALNYKSEDNVTEEISIPVIKTKTLTITASPEPLKITSPAGFVKDIVRFSDNRRLETNAGTDMYYEFSDVSMPADTVVKSAVLFVEHFEEEKFAEGKLEWAIGTGRPDEPVVWAVMKAPIHEGESAEAVDAWDITSVLCSIKRINSLQLQINNNNFARRKTFVDYAYVIIEYH